MKKQEETNVWKTAQLLLSQRGYRLFRNQRYKGQIVVRGKVSNAWVNCGLCDGAGDLIGYRILEISQEMIGMKFAQFVSIETKILSGHEKKHQADFKESILNAGGYAAVFKQDKIIEDYC